MNKDEKLEIIKVLEKWSKKGSRAPDPTRGICGNLDHLIGHGVLPSCADEYICRYFKNWGEFSGSIKFPVLNPLSGNDGHYEYIKTRRYWVGEYGASRRRLCAHIAKQMRKELKK